MLRRFIAGLFLALSPFIAQAAYQYRYISGSFDSGLQPSAAAVLSLWVEDRNASATICTSGARAGMPIGVHTVVNVVETTTYVTGYYETQSYSCATGAPSSPTQKSIPITRTGTPDPQTCTSGATTSKTYFSGWSTDTNGTNMVGGDVPPPSAYCDGTCSYTNPIPTTCNSDSELSPNGYYSGTCTYTYTANGQTCSTPTEDPGPTPEPPPQDPGGDPPDDGDPGDPGGPGDGPGDGGDPGDGGGPPGGDPEDPECGNAGQPACEDGGGGGGGPIGEGPGDGEDDGEEKRAECGVPGKPSCSVKVDESGTASVDQLIRQVEDMHDYTQTLSGPNGEINQMNDDLKNMNPGSVFGMNDWSWSFQLPTGCTPLVMADFNVTIDPCQWQSTIHDLMSMIWIISTFFGVLWIARGTF